MPDNHGPDNPGSTVFSYPSQDGHIASDLEGGVRGEISQALEQGRVATPLPTQLGQRRPQAVQGGKVQGHVHYNTSQVAQHLNLILRRSQDMQYTRIPRNSSLSKENTINYME